VLWIAVGATALLFLNQAFSFVWHYRFLTFFNAMVFGGLLVGLLMRQAWSFALAMMVFVLLILYGFGGWEHDHLLWFKNAIIGLFIVVPVILTREFLVREDGE